MSKKNLYIIAASVMMTFTSCSGFIEAILGVEDNPVSEENTAPVSPSTEEPSATEEDVKAVINATYINAALVISFQQTLEAFRLKKIDSEAFGASVINADNTTLTEAWSWSYMGINRANFIIGYLKGGGLDYAVDPYLTEAIALRSFVYYQLAMLWGDVPLVTEQTEETVSIPSSKQEDVLTYAYNQLSGVIDKFSTSNDASHFNKMSAQALLAEILLTLNRKDEAKTLLSGIKDQGGDDVFHTHYIPDVLALIPSSFASLLNSTSDFCVYDKTYIDFLYKEASGDTEGLADTWYSSTHLYGMWAAMKRLGVAQEKAGCEEYELVMPIPSSELLTNTLITQNPGY